MNKIYLSHGGLSTFGKVGDEYTQTHGNGTESKEWGQVG